MNLSLIYGRVGDMKNYNVNLSECSEDRGRIKCEMDIENEINEFDGNEIEYWFTIEDIAGNKDESKHEELSVDITPPILNNPDSFVERGVGRYSRYLYFDLSITEPNFDEAVLSYDYRGRTKEARLCSRLDSDGTCDRRLTTRDDYTNMKLIIRDEAGNEIFEEVDV